MTAVTKFALAKQCPPKQKTINVSKHGKKEEASLGCSARWNNRCQNARERVLIWRSASRGFFIIIIIVIKFIYFTRKRNDTAIRLATVLCCPADMCSNVVSRRVPRPSAWRGWNFGSLFIISGRWLLILITFKSPTEPSTIKKDKI